MMVEPTYKDFWDIPGGHVEPGESPAEACAREVFEELGIRPRIGALLVVDWAMSVKRGPTVRFVFDGGRLSAEKLRDIRLEDGELHRYEYVVRSDIAGRTIDRLVLRIGAALDAKRTGMPVYLERGLRVGPG